MLKPMFPRACSYMFTYWIPLPQVIKKCLCQPVFWGFHNFPMKNLWQYMTKGENW